MLLTEKTDSFSDIYINKIIIYRGVNPMKNNDIINNLTGDNIIDDIQADINAELEKYEPDYDKIAELTALITEFTGNSLSEEKTAENISRIVEEYDSQKRKSRIKILYSWISALSACLVLVLALNAYTMVSFGDNLFQTIVEMTQSGFSIDFSSIVSSGNPTTEPVSSNTTTMTKATTTIANTSVLTPQTIMTQPVTTGAAIFITTATKPIEIEGGSPSTTAVQAVTTEPTVQTTPVAPPGSAEQKNLGDIISEKCSEIGIMPCNLNYPAIMELKDFSYEENEVSTDCYFTFDDAYRQLDIIIEQYDNTEDIPNMLIPSNQDGYYSAISSDIGEIFLFDEDTHITAVFAYKNIVYTTIGHNFSFEDMEEIMQAYSPDKQN